MLCELRVRTNEMTMDNCLHNLIRSERDHKTASFAGLQRNSGSWKHSSFAQLFLPQNSCIQPILGVMLGSVLLLTVLNLVCDSVFLPNVYLLARPAGLL